MFVRVDKGYVDTRVKDARDFDPGELKTAEQAEYRVGSSDVWPTGMRALSGTLGSAQHIGVMFAEFKNSDDIIVAASGSALYEAVAGDTLGSSSQAQIVSSVGGSLENVSFSSAETMQGLTYLDKAYLCFGAPVNGLPQNLVRGYLGDSLTATWWPSGMTRPSRAPTVAFLTTAPTVAEAMATTFDAAGTWVDREKAYDMTTDNTGPIRADESFASVTRKTAGDSEQKWGFAGAVSSTAAGRTLYVLLSGDTQAQSVGVGGSGRSGADATMVVRISTTGMSGTFTEVWRKNIPTTGLERLAIDCGAINTQNIAVKVSLRVRTLAARSQVQCRVYSIYIAQGGEATTIATSLRYYFVEVDKEIPRESSMSPESALAYTAATTYGADVTIPEKLNPRTTNFRVFREADGGGVGEFDKYGFVGEIDATGVGPWTFRDNFAIPVIQVPKQLGPVLIIGSGPDIQFYPENQPPPLSRCMCIYKGAAVYVPALDDDKIFYSAPYRPESCNDLYNVPIRSSRNDSVQAVAANDNVLIVWMRGWTRRIQGLALVTNGIFDNSQPADASTTRGCCGPMAFAWFSLDQGDGNEWAAAVDYDGLYITNGYDFKPWSENLRWTDPTDAAGGLANRSYLHLVKVVNNPRKRRIEVFYPAVGSTIVNKKLYFYYGDIGRSGAREDGMPKVTGPHPVKAGGATFGFVDNTWKGWSGSEAGNVYLEDSGTADASQAGGSTAITRTVETGDPPLAGARNFLYLASSSLRTKGVGATSFEQTVYLTDYAGNIQKQVQTYDPNSPEPLCHGISGEFVRIKLVDTGTAAKDAIVGIDLEMNKLSGPSSAAQGRTGSTRTENTVPS